MHTIAKILIIIFLILTANPGLAENFFLDSSRNKGTLRFEINNDIIWDEDSNFTNGWSLQYHSVRYKTWKDTRLPDFVKWIGKRFPTLSDDKSIVSTSQGIGQNMITPGNLSSEKGLQGDLPYAGTLTYSFSWQSFNRQTARNFQATIGIMGDPSGAEEFQKFVHNDIGPGDSPKGWDSQRDTEPILNFGYEYAWRAAHFGNYNHGWAGQFIIAPSVAVGNLFTAAELNSGLRFGWNILEGFSIYPAPPGRGLFQSSYIPKPESASPHGIEFLLGARVTGLAYSVIYDGSFITEDSRNVDRKNFYATWGAGIYYHYYDTFSIRGAFEKSTDLLKEKSIPNPPSGKRKTNSDVSFGSLIIDFYF